MGAGTDGITFTCPPLEIANRPVPSGFPVPGSKIILPALERYPLRGPNHEGTCARRCRNRPPAQTKSPSNARKSPARSAAVGTVVTTEAPVRRRVP